MVHIKNLKKKKKRSDYTVIFKGYASYQTHPRRLCWQFDNSPLNLGLGPAGAAAGRAAQAQTAGVGSFKDENDG